MPTVEEIIAAINELPPEKRDELRRQLASFGPLRSEQSTDDAEQANRAYRTYLSYTKSPKLPIKRTRPRRPPIKIKGKPLSETVVEDRR